MISRTDTVLCTGKSCKSDRPIGAVSYSRRDSEDGIPWKIHVVPDIIDIFLMSIYKIIKDERKNVDSYREPQFFSHLFTSISLKHQKRICKGKGIAKI